MLKSLLLILLLTANRLGISVSQDVNMQHLDQMTAGIPMLQQDAMGSLELYLNDLFDKYFGWIAHMNNPKKLLMEEMEKEFEESGTISPESLARVAEVKAKMFARMKKKKPRYDDLL